MLNQACAETEVQLSHEEEAQIGEEKEVRKEDQERINRFSRLHGQEQGLEAELKAKEVCKETASSRLS